jgi:lipopolysaccharide/colanic/teichoic acid biosynthesis glycosyltransferase
MTQPNDPRVPVSLRWVRRLHLDELPQLYNILKGEMSWVGPRPEQVSITEDLESRIDFFWLRHTAMPGLTGWAQVNMGYAGDLDSARQRFGYDLYYIANRNIALDASIMLRTLRNLITADGR